MSQGPEQKNIQDETRAHADKALAETLAELGLAPVPDQSATIKTADAAVATPVDSDVTMGKTAGGRRRRNQAGGTPKKAHVTPTPKPTAAPTPAPTAMPDTTVSTKPDAVPDPDAERLEREAAIFGIVLAKGDDFLPTKPDEVREYDAGGERGFIRLLPDGTYQVKRGSGPEAVVKPQELEARIADWQLVAAAGAVAAAVEVGPPVVPTPEVAPAVSAKTLDEVQAEIDRVDQQVTAARTEYIRIEDEANKGWERVKRVFRNLRGKEETNPDVLAAKEEYEEKLNRLKLLELEKVRVSGLTGERLRQHLAEVVVEYNFKEAEKFDDARRVHRDGDKAATFKQKWDRIKKNMAAPHRTHDGISSLNLAVHEPTWKDWAGVIWGRTKLVAESSVAMYGEATKTTKGKMIAAGVGIGSGVLFFTSGGAAVGVAAGLLYYGRKALAGASTTVGVKAGMDAVVARRRSSKAVETSQEVASVIMGASKDALRESVEEGKAEPSLESLNNVGISEQGLQMLEQYLMENTDWRKQAAKRELWRRSRLWAAVAIGVGVTGLGHWHEVPKFLEKIGIDLGGATPEEVRQVADRLAAAPPAAEAAASPASAASGAAQRAAESVSTPAGAASAPVAEGGAMASPASVSGVPPAPADGGESIPFSEGGAVHYDNGYHASDRPGIAVEQGEGRAPSSVLDHTTSPNGEAPLDRQAATRMLTEVQEIKPGDTLGRFATLAAQQAGIEDPAVRRRFARLFIEHVNARLAQATGEAAEAAGFLPHPDGHFTADLIPAKSDLDLSRIGVTAQDIEHLLDHAEHGTAPTAVVITPEIAGAGETLAGTSSPTGGVSEVVTTSTGPAVETVEVSHPDAFVSAEASPQGTLEPGVTESSSADTSSADETIRRRMITLDTLKTLPRAEQFEVFRAAKQLELGLLRTPESMGENFDPAANKRLGMTWMVHILRDVLSTQENPTAAIDTTRNPLHASQMGAVQKFAQAVEQTFGRDFAKPAARESVQEYVLRSVLLARMKGVTLPGMVD